jgi:hypothetical protein
MDSPNVQQLPTNSVSEPASGTYGEKAASARLEQALPLAPQGQSSPQGPAPAQAAAPGPGPAGPPPTSADILLQGPTTQPEISPNTPLAAMPAPMQAQTPEQAMLAKLELLANDPGVSKDTKVWASQMRDRIARGSLNV